MLVPGIGTAEDSYATPADPPAKDIPEVEPEYFAEAQIFSDDRFTERQRTAMAALAAYVVVYPGRRRIDARRAQSETPPVFNYVLGVLMCRPVCTATTPVLPPSPLLISEPVRPRREHLRSSDLFGPAESLLWIVAQPPAVCPPLHRAIVELRTNDSL